MTGLQSKPKAITIVPERDDLQTGAHSVPYPEEAVTLQVP
jgi:hypothetical protein